MDKQARIKTAIEMIESGQFSHIDEIVDFVRLGADTDWAVFVNHVNDIFDCRIENLGKSTTEEIIEKIQVETGCGVQDIVLEHDKLTDLLFPQIEQVGSSEKSEKAFRIRDYRAQIAAFGEIVDWLEK